MTLRGWHGIAALAAALLLAGAGWLLFDRRSAPETAVSPELEAPTPPAEAVPEAPAPAPPPMPERAAKTAERMNHPLIARDPWEGMDRHTLHGEVVDEVSGEPVQFVVGYLAAVEEGDIEYLARDNRFASIFRNSVGTFTWRGLERGKYNLLIRCQGYRDVVLRDLPIPHPEKKLRVALSRGAWIEANVVDAEGDGIGEVEVRLVPIQLDDPKTSPRVHLLRTDNYGKALFSDLPTGTYQVKLLNEALCPDPSPQFYLAPGGNYPARFIIRELNTLFVKVTDTQGNALGNAHVRLLGKDAARLAFRMETDAEGEAEHEFVPPGEYTVKVWKPGFRRLTRTLAIASPSGEHREEIRLRVDPGGEPTLEELERIKNGESASDVFSDHDG